MEKSQEFRDLDLSGAARGVWLVKVPKYLSEKWKRASASSEVGKLRISKSRVAGAKPEVIFTLSDQLATMESTDVVPVPKDHKFVLTGLANQTLSILANQSDAGTAAMEAQPEKLSVEGQVIQRAECRPMADANYMRLKRTQMEISNRPTREVQQLDKVVQNYKPRAAHKNEVEYGQKKKDEGKRSRLDKEKVMDLLFAAFEKHQYYNVKDLVRITQQPITYLKEILNEICLYNMKAPHKNMWELKPEFRHYKQQGESSNT